MNRDTIQTVSARSKRLNSGPECLFWAIFKFRLIFILNMRTVWNATKCIPLDSVRPTESRPTESSDIIFVIFRYGRAIRQRKKYNHMFIDRFCISSEYQLILFPFWKKKMNCHLDDLHFCQSCQEN